MRSFAHSRYGAEANLKASLPNANPLSRRHREGVEVNLLGTPAEIAARLGEYAAAGVTDVCAIFYSPDAATGLRQMELFADELIPAVTSIFR